MKQRQRNSNPCGDGAGNEQNLNYLGIAADEVALKQISHCLGKRKPRQEHLHGTDNQLIQLGGRKEHMRRAGGKTRNQTAIRGATKKGIFLRSR